MCLFAVPAHLPIENINEFYNGILHPLLVPAHLLTIITAGLLAGQQPSHTLLRSRIFMGAAAVGLILSALGVRIATPLPLIVYVLVIAIAVAARSERFPVFIVTLAPVPLGILLGIDSAFDGLTTKGLVWSLLGCLLSVSFSSFYVALLVKKASRPWQHIAVRVAASWVTAICLMVAALQFAQR
ncbi:MAG: HupE/UreJ family protein [Deltaproteobacteria bacterium]|nr:HupE/UreJ family protein [Deltaproteobacteria bacterium]MBN2674049.1 HupE/UreJ family protein [Deltaproteobacteria bacterium]